MRSSKGRNRKRPAKGVRKEVGDRCKRRTSATLAISGFTVTGRSSSARRGRREKPSSRSKTVRELTLHVIDGEIAFAHGHGQIANAVAGGRGLRSALGLAEEGSAFLRIVAELM